MEEDIIINIWNRSAFTDDTYAGNIIEIILKIVFINYKLLQSVSYISVKPINFYSRIKSTNKE